MGNGHRVNIRYSLARHLVHVVLLWSETICVGGLLKAFIKAFDLDFIFHLLSPINRKTRLILILWRRCKFAKRGPDCFIVPGIDGQP